MITCYLLFTLYLIYLLIDKFIDMVNRKRGFLIIIITIIIIIIIVVIIIIVTAAVLVIDITIFALI